MSFRERWIFERLRIASFVLNVDFLLLTSLSAHAFGEAAPYYQGGTIRIVVGTAPGGSFDMLARFFARYLARYIAGKPNIIVQNMPGGRQKIATNYLFNIAKPDGTNVGTVHAHMALLAHQRRLTKFVSVTGVFHCYLRLKMLLNEAIGLKGRAV